MYYNTLPMDSPGEIIVLITAPKEEEALVMAKAVVESKLAACVNLVRNIRSIYRWQGAIEDDSETLMVVKTRTSLLAALTEKVKELHSYDVPEVIALPIIGGSQEYIQWLNESTQQ